MGQYAVNPRIIRHVSSELTGGAWEVGHHIGNPASGQVASGVLVLTATQVTDLSTAVADSDAEVWQWVQDELPASWQWTSSASGYFRTACQDVGL